MRFAAILLALAFLPLAAAAQERDQEQEPDWDCSVELSDDGQRWSVDHVIASWAVRPYPNGGVVRLTSIVSTDHDKHHFVEDGPFSQWSSSYISVSPRLARSRGKMWAHLAVGDRSLEPEEMSRSNGFFTSASFKAHEVMELLGEDSTLTVTLYKRDGEIFDRFTLERSAIEAGAERLQALFGEYQERLANPEAHCQDRNDVIIIPH